MIAYELFTEWPYDHAVQWMQQKHEQVSLNPHMAYCAVGTHKEKVISLGRDSGRGSFVNEALAHDSRFIVRVNDRGGGITAHEPGQLVLYPVLNLRAWNFCVRDLVTLLERSALQLAASCGVTAHCRSDSPGIFIGKAKIGFIGMRIKDGVSTHGLALNVLNDAQIFNSIEPCGIKDLEVASLYQFAALEKNIACYGEQLAQLFVACLSAMLRLANDE